MAGFVDAAGVELTRAPQVPSYVFANLPTVGVGAMAVITDASTNTWGATISGSGANTVLAWFNGTNWTVVGK